MLFWHTHRGPLNRVSSTRFPILPLGIASFHGTAPARRSILSFPSSGWYNSLIWPNFPLSGVHTFPLFIFMVFVDVGKGSPLLPACFFPFYFLWVNVYIRRIWLGDRRDVLLVSYIRDLGVCRFPGVRRIGFLLAIALKLNAVFVPYFILFWII